MASKKKVQVPLEELSKEELIKKCYNQRELIKKLQDGGKYLLTLNELLKVEYGNMTIPHKVKIAYDETFSYMEDVERLKNEIRKLKGESE